jgi:hypothetical protein
MKKTSRLRGRPRNILGHSYSNEDSKCLENLSRIALRTDIDPTIFFNALVDSWQQNEANCQELTIMCRKRNQDSAIFLFTIGEKVMGQFPVSKLILQENNPLKDYIKQLMPYKFFAKKPRAKNPKIIDLDPSMKQVSLKARVIETPIPKLVYTKFGTEAYVSNVILADETGNVKLGLWNQHIKKVSVDDVITLEKVNVTRFRGELQLRLRRNSVLTVIKGERFPSIDYLKKL